jgi:isoquinoline 1-oxidoreductase subunit beta
MKVAEGRIENNIIENVSRRGFLQGALASGVLVLTARFVAEPLWAAEGEAAAAFDPSMWMGIASDGTVTIIAHRSEMGCGSRTALPIVVADELDADWTQRCGRTVESSGERVLDGAALRCA